MVPRSDFEILDNWYVAGLCGSGSKDLEVKDEFVPTDRTLDPERAGNGDFTG
jgi:3-hydroxy-9,10-secoandrosta-1,3,5(10)-triene-9,17-dione monooxygenase